MSGARIALVLVSHSSRLADGVVELAAQMAPAVDLRSASGTDDGRLGTSLDKVQQAIADALAGGAAGVLLLTDLGSATMTAETVVELLDDDRVRLADAPFVEAAVAAAVAAQGGAGLDAVATAALDAVDSFAAAPSAPAGVPAAASAGSGDDGAPLQRDLVLVNPMGLHARPAAMLARLVATLDASVQLNGVDAASVLALMSLGLAEGAPVQVTATGPQAQDALDQVASQVEAGFGET